jgi:hypothetical protein
VWLVTETSLDTTLAELAPGHETLAKVTPLGRADEAELEDLQLRVLETIHEHDRLDLVPAVGSSLIGLVLERDAVPADAKVVERLATLNQKVEQSDVCRCAVVAADGSTPTEPLEMVRAQLGG